MLKNRFLVLIGTYSDDLVYNSNCWEEIEHSYSGTSRYYHNLAHIENMLTELQEVESKVKDLDTLIFSIFYHDVVYKSTSKRNEEKSAALCTKRLTKTSFKNLDQCKLQIEATKHHDFSEDHDTNILLDLDLSILGQDQDIYMTYARNIRKEYAVFPDFMYNKGRKKVLQSMLSKNHLFKTAFFQKKYEQQAKINLNLELETLN